MPDPSRFLRTGPSPSFSRISLAAALVLAGCGKSDDQSGRPPQRTPEVGYVLVQPQDVPLVNELTGRTSPFETSEVRPQASGVIRRRFFTEGALVRAGQTLYQIDPSLYQAAAAQASANLASAQATAEAARARADRYRPLAQIEAVSKQDYTDAAAAARQASAAVAQGQAQLRTARVNLNYTNVPAPISGRIGRSLFTPGALVTANQAEPLAVIQRLDPIYVDIQQSSAELLALRRALTQKGVVPASARVRLVLEDGSDYPLTGSVQFNEVTVDPATGTVTLRATFPNPQGLLLPGMFVRARITQAVDKGAYLVPQQSISRDRTGAARLLVVGPGNKAMTKTVVADRAFGSNWVVTAGLAPGDKVIVQGTGAARPDQVVRPVPADTPQRLRPGGGPGGRGGMGPGGGGGGQGAGGGPRG